MKEGVPRALNDGTSFYELSARFMETPYGQTIAEQPRWDTFRPHHVTTEEWGNVIGHDANTQQHARVMHKLMRQFIRHSPEGALSQDDQQILLLCTIASEWGEAGSIEDNVEPLGNIAYGKRTSNDEKQERAAFRIIFDKMMGEGNLKAGLMVESTLFDPGSRLGGVYDTVRRINYVRTALSAYEKSAATKDQELAGNLQWLTADVMRHQMPSLLQHAKAYPATEKYLNSVKKQVDAVFTRIHEQVFAQHGEPERFRIDMFRHARDLWYASESASTDSKIGQKQHDRGIFGDSANFEARYIKDLQRLKEVTEAFRTLGLKIVLTSGSFDMIHAGHTMYLEEAKKYGDVLVVGVDSDKKVRDRKGPSRPVVPEDGRLRMLTDVRSVDIVTLKHPEHEKWALIKTVRPDTLIATQETYKDEEIKELYEYCGRVVVLPPMATTSTSAQVRRIQMETYRRFQAILELDVSDAELRRLLGEVAFNAVTRA